MRRPLGEQRRCDGLSTARRNALPVDVERDGLAKGDVFVCHCCLSEDPVSAGLKCSPRPTGIGRRKRHVSATSWSRRKASACFRPPWKRSAPFSTHDIIAMCASERRAQATCGSIGTTGRPGRLSGSGKSCLPVFTICRGGVMSSIRLVLTHITIAAVTIYLHRHQAHRALELHPARQPLLSLLAVADDRHGHAGVGCDSPQAPRQMRDRRRSAQPAGLRHSQSAAGKVRSSIARSRRTARPWSVTARARRTTGSSATSTAVHACAASSLMLIVDFALFGFIGITVWAVQMIWIPLWRPAS